MQAAQEAEVNQQDIMPKFAELGKQAKFGKIKYDTIRKKNSIAGHKKKEASEKINIQSLCKP